MKKIMILAICVAAFMEGRSQNGIAISSTTTPSTTTVPAILTPDMTIVGNGAGTGGTNNSFFGNNAGAVNTSDDNCFFGYNSGAAATTTTSEQNCFFGSNTGLVSTTSSHNCFFGYNAGSASTTTGQNCFFGWRAGVANITGNDNTFYGTSSGQAYTSGVDNVMIGGGSGATATSGMANTFVGDKTGGSNLSGSFNSLLGFEAKLDGKSLQYATAIGADATVQGSHSIVLGRTNPGVGNYEWIGIGTNAPQYQLDFEIQPNDYFYLSGIGAPVALPYQQLVLDANNYVSVVPAGPANGENGVSISPADGNVVLGQDACPGSGFDPAALLSTRYVPLNNQYLLFPDGPTPIPTGGPQGRIGIGVCTPGAKLDVYRPQVSEEATPIGLQVINNDLSTDAVAGTGIGANITVNNANPTNIGAVVNVSGSSSSVYPANEGISLNVSAAVAGTYNIGYNANIIGSGDDNRGVTIGISDANTGAQNRGYDAELYNDNATSNTGMHVHVQGDNVSALNVGVEGNVGGANSENIGIWGEVKLPPSGSNTGASCRGVYGIFDSGADGAQNFGVEGDLGGVSIPISGNANPYFAIYGVAPGYAGSSQSSNPYSGANSNYSYAGYFEGDVFCSNTYYYSDPKLKENIEEYTGALNQIKKLPVKSYTFKNDEYPKMNLPLGNQVGVLSTDLKSVFPNLVKGAMHPGNKKKGESNVTFDAVNYTALIPVIIQAMQELNAKTDSVATDTILAKTVGDLRSQVVQQEQQLAAQCKQISDLREMLNDLCTNGCAGFNPNGNNQSPNQNAALHQSIPNPSSGIVSIGYLINIPYTNASINVVTMDGVLISSYPISGQGSGSVSFDCSNVASGTYKYYMVADGKIIDTKTIVITSK